MKVYIISNFINLEEKELEKIKENDLIVLFNHAFPLKFEKIRNHKNKWFFLRANKVDYWGSGILLKKYKIFSKIFLINKRQKYMEKLKNLKIDYDLIDEKDYKENQRPPTSGFIGFKRILKEFDLDDIILVNFTGHRSDGKAPPKFHNYKFEQEYYKNIGVKMVKW